MKEINIYKYDEVYFKISTSEAIHNKLKKLITVWDPARFFNPKYKMKIWDGSISLYKNNLFPIGLWYKVVDWAKKFDVKLEYDFKPKSIYLLNLDKDKFYDDVKDYAKFEPRDYQWESAYAGLNKKRGLLQLPTGSGKSFIIHMMIRYIYEKHLKKGKKIVLLMNNIGLVEQMYSDFQDYRQDGDESPMYDDIAVIYSAAEKDRKDLNKTILFTTYQSFIKLNSLFHKVQAIFVDEVQIAKSNSVVKINSALTRAEFRIGLSATIPKEDFDNYQIQAYLGRIVYRLKAKELMDRGILAPVKIYNLLVDYMDSDEKEIMTGKNYNNILAEVSNNEKRNKVLDYIFDDNTDKDENTIMLFKRVKDSLEPVYKYLKAKYPNRTIYKITGEVKGKKREEIRKSMTEQNGCILLGTEKIVSFGLNIPNINNVVLFNPLKSDITLMQAIGRSLRVSPNKLFAKMFDVVDFYFKKPARGKTKYGLSMDHLKSKIAVYKDEEYEYYNDYLIYNSTKKQFGKIKPKDMNKKVIEGLD